MGFFSSVAKAVGGVASGAADLVGGVVKGAGQVVSGVANVAGDVVTTAGNIAGALSNPFGKIAGGFIKSGVGLIFGDTAGQFVGSIVDGVVNLPGNLIRGAGQIVGGAIKGVGQLAAGVASVAGGVISGVGKVVGGIAKGVGKALDFIGGGLGSIVSGIGSFIGGIFGGGPSKKELRIARAAVREVHRRIQEQMRILEEDVHAPMKNVVNIISDGHIWRGNGAQAFAEEVGALHIPGSGRVQSSMELMIRSIMQAIERVESADANVQRQVGSMISTIQGIGI